MLPRFTYEQPKTTVLNTIEEYLKGLDFKIAGQDLERPWGGFFVIDEGQTRKFIKLFFNQYTYDQIAKYGTKLSPKILVVEPTKRLSWQYHNRRAEIWTVLSGPVGVVISRDDNQTEIKSLPSDTTIQIEQNIRHRLVGLDNSWGIVAEIWQHTDHNQPSDEHDIIRVEDDFGR
jgi:mannose-6-phosphate isomerase-like protein (cupin superfamily)